MSVNLKLKLFQTLSEALLPLLGYFYWNWSFYDLLLFYFLDLLVATTFTFVKIKKVVIYTKTPSPVFMFTIGLFVCYFTIILLSVDLLPEIMPGFDFLKDTSRFFMLKDMGIPQGILLLPLVFYAGYLQYKMKFIQLNLVQKTS